MITRDQWDALQRYVVDRLQNEETFSVSDQMLEERFGITHPFWDGMCNFAREKDRSYTGDKHWWTSDGEPTEIVYRRKRDND